MSNTVIKTATIKSAKTINSIGKTFAYIQNDGENHITELWIAGASEKRAEFLKPGKKISYATYGAKETAKEGKHIWTDNTFRITFLPDQQG